MGLRQGLQGSAQVVRVHVAAQLPVKGGAPPDVNCNGPGQAVDLVPPTLWNIQGIPRLHRMSSASVRSVPAGTVHAGSHCNSVWSSANPLAPVPSESLG